MRILSAAIICAQMQPGFSFAFQTKDCQPPQLFPYQQEGVERLVRSKRVLLADEMGLGKTVQCIAAIDSIYHNHLTVLIVCPKSVIGVWERELEQWLKSPLNLLTASPKSFPLASNGSITLINYDICHKFREELQQGAYDVLICDEAHSLKSLTSKRTLSVLGNGTTKNPGIQTEYLWLLTGTPVLNRPVELYPLLRALAPDQFNSFVAFAERYCLTENSYPRRGRHHNYYSSAMDFSGATNLSELSKRIEPFMLRRYKIDVLSQLPPKFRSCVCLTGSDVATLERERLRAIMAATPTPADSSFADLESFGSEASALISYLGKCADLDVDDPVNRNKLIGSLATIRRETAFAKLDPAVELLHEIIQSRKVVVFAHHREVILALAERFGEQAVCLMGGMDSETRSTAVRRFQEDNDVRIFIGSIRAAGVGLTLTAASHVIFLEMDWSPSVMTQAEDRCHRVGQLDSVQVQYFVFRDTIDEWVAKSLLYKQFTIDQILPEKIARVNTGYVFDFGKHIGLRLEDVPRNYITFLVRNEVWRQRPSLWKALFMNGIVFEEPPVGVSNEDVIPVADNKHVRIEQPSSTNIEHVDYVFDFGRHNGKKWSEVPQQYREWIVREGIWKSRINLKGCLIRAGLLAEDVKR